MHAGSVLRMSKAICYIETGAKEASVPVLRAISLLRMVHATFTTKSIGTGVHHSHTMLVFLSWCSFWLISLLAAAPDPLWHLKWSCKRIIFQCFLDEAVIPIHWWREEKLENGSDVTASQLHSLDKPSGPSVGGIEKTRKIWVSR